MTLDCSYECCAYGDPAVEDSYRKWSDRHSDCYECPGHVPVRSEWERHLAELATDAEWLASMSEVELAEHLAYREEHRRRYAPMADALMSLFLTEVRPKNILRTLESS